MKYTLHNENDFNESIEIEADSYTEALEAALAELGWGFYESDEENEEE